MHVRVTVDVTFDPETVKETAVLLFLEDSVAGWVSRGGLSGDTPMCVDDYKVKVEEVTK